MILNILKRCMFLIIFQGDQFFPDLAFESKELRSVEIFMLSFMAPEIWSITFDIF